VLGPGADYGSVNYRWFSERYESFAYLDRVAIDAAHQSRGLGAALYGEVERRLAGSVPWFVLEVNLRPRNDGSLRFHSRQGFVEVGQQDTNYGTLVSLLAKPLV
jgi:predicted GNAT superfamily acetyltransferase